MFEYTASVWNPHLKNLLRLRRCKEQPQDGVSNLRELSYEERLDKLQE